MKISNDNLTEDLFDVLFPQKMQTKCPPNRLSQSEEANGDSHTKKVWSISNLVTALQQIIEENLATIWVEGEISNFTKAASGHCYFVLKDEQTQIKAVMFKGYANSHLKILKDGTRVLFRGRVGIYAGRGELQFIAEYAEPCGEGALRLAFEALKKKMEAEGLFALDRKRELPLLPKKIFLITSTSGAAIHDFLQTASKRNRACEIVVCPSRVQGEGASEELRYALNQCNSCAKDGDVIVLARGGGSIEDLWSFNDEALARAIFASKTPVVSAVGHEVDFTIADFVADLRAATPTQAAMLVLPDQQRLLGQTQMLKNQLHRQLSHILNQKKNTLLVTQHKFVHPLKKLYEQRQRLDELRFRLDTAIDSCVQKKRLQKELVAENLLAKHPQNRINQLKIVNAALLHHISRLMTKHFSIATTNFKVCIAKIEALSPLNALKRGYSIVTLYDTNEVVTDAAGLTPDTIIKIKPSKGMAIARILGSEGQGEL